MSRAPGTPRAARLAEKHLLTTLLPLIAVLSASIPTQRRRGHRLYPSSLQRGLFNGKPRISSCLYRFYWKT
ncbi:MAG: hypothetical protein LM588_05900 [Fervidicoccaceae archaeon]|nr:hypothetical protein [Fervidicoccaceae archaeon]